MKDEYIYNEAIKKCNEKIENAKALQAELKKVQFVTKKNGEPFNNIDKNITGANIWHMSYLPRSCKHIRLSVHVNGRYVDDSIALFKSIPGGYEQLTVEEVKEKIKELDKSYTRRILEAKRAMTLLEPIFNYCDEFTSTFKNEPYSTKQLIKKYIERSL